MGEFSSISQLPSWYSSQACLNPKPTYSATGERSRQGRLVFLQILIPLTLCARLAEEGIGAGTELRSPCECESLVEFQGRTLGALEKLTQNHILWGREPGLEGRGWDPRTPHRLP